MRNSLFIFFILVTTISFSQEDSVESPKIAIKIPLGETITLDNNTIKFVEILEDSRCPKYTNCIWEGRARVLVEVSENGKASFEKTLIFGKTMEGETKDNKLFSYNDANVIGLTLNPYPNSKEDFEGATYVLLVYLVN